VIDASPAIEDKLQRLAYYNTLIDRVRAVPGVVAVGSSTGVPIVGGGSDGTYLLLDNPSPPNTYDWSAFPAPQKGHAEFRIVDGNYFAAMGIHLLKGRLFQATDTYSAPHAGVVSAKFAAQAWPGQNPLGKIVEYGNMDADLRPFTVVGVVADIRDDGLAADAPPLFYGYLPQRPGAYGQTLVVRTSGDPTAIIASVRRIVHDLRTDVPVRTKTIDRVIAESVADRRFTLFVVAAFAGAALLLATLGVYSVVSYLVTQRTREIGVRVALGAQHGQVLSLIVGEGLRLAAMGLVLGVIGSMLLARTLRGLVYGVSPTDPAAFASVVALLAIVAVVAAWVPARRAARVDPMQVLRSA
jgi:predicted permease